MESQSQEFKIIEREKKTLHRKPVRVPVNYESIDKWKMPSVTQDQIAGPFTEESSFATLFPKYREKYIREVFGLVQKALMQHGVKAELDLAEGSISVKTTKKTFDPYVIIKARDVIKLLSRSVPYEVCLRLLEDDVYCDLIKIKSLVPNREKFLKRRQRLVGPNGNTIKALEILTECYLMVQGHTISVIGHYKKLKIVRRIVEQVMKNIHPVFYIKQLMVRKELEKDESLKDENWEKYLPQIPKKINMKTKKFQKEKKEYNPFPNPVQARKQDLEMDTGEYFLTQE